MAPVADDKMLLGRLSATIENLVASLADEKVEARERTRKLDNLLDRIGAMEELNREQARDTKAQISEAKHAHANQIQVITRQIELIDLHIKKLEVQSETSGSQLTRLTIELAEVKSDTTKLQIPVSQLVGARRAIIAWGAAIITVMGFLAWVIHATNLVGQMIGHIGGTK